MLFSLLTLAYFLKVQRKAFFGLLKDEWQNVKEAGPAMTLPMIILALACLALGVSFPWLYGNLLQPAASVLGSLIVR
jgi:multicomponent Na+:H+ antiporter subunit D